MRPPIAGDHRRPPGRGYGSPRRHPHSHFEATGPWRAVWRAGWRLTTVVPWRSPGEEEKETPAVVGSTRGCHALFYGRCDHVAVDALAPARGTEVVDLDSVPSGGGRRYPGRLRSTSRRRRRRGNYLVGTGGSSTLREPMPLASSEKWPSEHAELGRLVVGCDRESGPILPPPFGCCIGGLLRMAGPQPGEAETIFNVSPSVGGIEK